ncbi:hypothetical protein Bca4012_011939 [Brassica carinata]
MIVAGFAESKKDHGNELIEKLEAGVQDMLQIVEDRKRDAVAPKQKKILQYVGGIEEDMVDCFPYEVPEEYKPASSQEKPLNWVCTRRRLCFYSRHLGQWQWLQKSLRMTRIQPSVLLLKESERTPSNSNIFDGRYAIFGYVTQNEDFLADLKVGDVTKSIQVVSG